MAQLEQFQEIFSLGKTLVTLFSDHDRTDLTTSWMAHYLTEIMNQADNESDLSKKRQLQKECSEIILELWRKRNQFPDSMRPLSGLKHAVEIIKALKDEESEDFYWKRIREDESDSVWGRYVISLRRTIEDAVKIALSASVAYAVFEREMTWNKHEAFLFDEEKEILNFLDKELNKTDTLIRIIYSSRDDSNEEEAEADTMTKVFKKLHELLEKQSTELKKLEEKVMKKTKKDRRTKK